MLSVYSSLKAPNDSCVLVVQTLCSDVLAILKTMYGDAPPAIILVGHRLPSVIILIIYTLITNIGRFYLPRNECLCKFSLYFS